MLGQLARSCLLAATLAPVAGCAALTSMCGPAPGTPAVHPMPVAGTDLYDWKGVVHCHSHLSHDSRGTVAEIAAACRTARVDFLVMTDHQTDESVRDGVRGWVGDTLWLCGAEVRSNKGTVLAFPLTKPLRRVFDVRALVAEAQAQGALVFLAHAERNDAWGTAGLAGVEVVNLHAGALASASVGMLMQAVLLPVRSVMSAACRPDPAVFAGWDRELARRHPATPIGGNDAHANIQVFGPLGGTVADYGDVFLTLSTHVLAPRLDEAALVEAFALGRSYVVYDLLRDGTGFDFRAVDASGVHLMGDTVAGGEGLRLLVHSPVRAQLRLLHDGVLAMSRFGSDLELATPAPGVYRVEADLAGEPWLFSSTIRVTAAAAAAAAAAADLGAANARE